MNRPGKEAISFPTRCIRCHHPTESPLVCDTCSALQPVGAEVDAFSLLQLDPTYRLDPRQLDDAYLQASRRVHPDYFGQAAQDSQTLSEDLSARVNDAYRTLKDPLTRSEYLLARAGGPGPSDDKRVAPELLAEVIELREEIDEARQAGLRDRLAELNGKLKARHDQAVSRLAELHDQLERAQAGGGEAVSQLAKKIRTALNGIRYLQGLVRESRT